MGAARAACLASSAALHIAALAWLALPPAPAARSVVHGAPPRTVLWIAAAPAKPTAVVSTASAKVAPRARPVAAVPARRVQAADVALQAPRVEPEAEVETSAPAPVVFAPPTFGGWGAHRRWGPTPGPAPVDVAVLAMAQRQQLQAAAQEQARRAWESAEPCRRSDTSDGPCAADLTPP